MKFTTYDQYVIDETFRAIEAETGFDRQSLTSRRRTVEIVYARFIAMHVIKKRTRLKLKGIGFLFSRDHSSVIHALAEVNNWLDNPARYISEVIQTKKVDDAVLDSISSLVHDHTNTHEDKTGSN